MTKSTGTYLENIAASAFRIAEEYGEWPERCEHPVLLGFTEEERQWTRKERSPRELADFVIEDKIRSTLLSTALYYNNIGYSGFDCEGELVFLDGRYFYQADPGKFPGSSEEELKFELSNGSDGQLYGPMLEEAKKDPGCLHAFLVFRDRAEDSGYYVILRVYPDLPAEEARLAFRREVFADFLSAAEVNSYKGLGRFMNRCQKIFVEAMKNRSVSRR